MGVRYNSSVEETEVTRNLFALNASNQQGGGLWLSANNLTESVVQNIWVENEVDAGGAMH